MASKRKRKLEALEAETAMWRRYAAGNPPVDEIALGPDESPLCREFRHGSGAPCEGCPVFVSTGKRFCSGTSYYEAALSKVAGDERRFRNKAGEYFRLLKKILDHERKH